MDTLLARQCEPTSREDSRIHEGGHAEVGQDKHEDDSIVDGDRHGESLREPWTAVEEHGRVKQGLVPNDSAAFRMQGDRVSDSGFRWCKRPVQISCSDWVFFVLLNNNDVNLYICSLLITMANHS